MAIFYTKDLIIDCDDGCAASDVSLDAHPPHLGPSTSVEAVLTETVFSH